MSYPELWQMHFSLYPEKVRWALDYKRVPHIRHSLLPGPHAVRLIARFGQKAMPILRHEGNVLKTSAAVLDYVEQTWPELPLYPKDPDSRAQALALQKWFDDKIGPAVRRAGFYEMLPHTEYSARRIATGLPEWQQKLYVSAFPAIRAIMMLDMQINAAGAEAGCTLTQEALDFVARNSERTGYLVGDRFSVADLTAATILFPTCLPSEYPVDIPRPLPSGWEHWLERWRNHPGCEYVRRIYREHRGVSAAVGG
ncbi:glutathione S-transferase family protein [Isoalcanivorax indicus]|uniref:glutathione S-transferase family protein n=1 Tax=Isoalcanivorax indicus TaxID=2202653 RepID=UPI000DB9751E|nr:glutathione S-transferase family protein [Isoalcanivorax indicus]